MQFKLEANKELVRRGHLSKEEDSLPEWRAAVSWQGEASVKV